MKTYLLKASGIVAMAALLSTSVFAQDEKEKTKNKGSDNDVIIITKKGGGDTRVTIEVKDGEVTVNGKPLDEYKDGDITVRRARTYNSNSNGLGSTRVYSPFRSEGQVQGQVWSNGDNLFEGGKTAYLGVVTEKTDDGAKITSVSNNTAAEKAGLQEGDIITHIDDARIDDHDDLTKAIRKHKPEDKVNISYLRDGRERQTVATLGKTGGAIAMTAPSPNFNIQPKIDMKNNFDFNNDFKGVFSYSGHGRLGIRAQDTDDGRGAKV